jgi:iron complex transport system substrate-binding protein
MKKFVIACSFLLLSLLAYQQFRLSQKGPIPASAGRRLISLSPTLTETLFELGSGDQLVGVTTYCDYPPDAQKKERIGDFVNPNLERIIELRPDLIFAERWSSSKIVSLLREAGLEVVELNSPRSIAEIYEMILQTGRSLNKEASARNVVDDMKGKIETIRAKAAKMAWHPAVYVEIDLPSWTVGRTSYTSEAIELCGARNIFGDIEKPALQVSRETVIERNPDVILSFGSPLSEYRERPGWGRIKAIQQGRVIHDVGRNLLSHGNHRLVVGMEQLQTRLLEMQPHEN